MGANVMYRPTRVRHIQFAPTSLLFDARHVFNAINEAKQKGAIERSDAFNMLERELGQISLHLATRANILNSAIDSMSRHMEQLIDIVRSSTEPPQYAIKVPDALVYGLLLNMDSFFFEAKAFEEALRRFFIRTAQHLLNLSSSASRQTYLQMASQCGEVSNEPWGNFLYRVRKTFIHRAAPWVAVDLSRSEDGVFDFLIMSENIKDFKQARPGSFFPSIAYMNYLWGCLQRMAEVSEEFLIDRISKLRKSDVMKGASRND